MVILKIIIITLYASWRLLYCCWCCRCCCDSIYTCIRVELRRCGYCCMHARYSSILLRLLVYRWTAAAAAAAARWWCKYIHVHVLHKWKIELNILALWSQRSRGRIYSSFQAVFSYLALKSTIWRTVSWSCLTLIAPLDSAGVDLGRFHFVSWRTPQNLVFADFLPPNGKGIVVDTPTQTVVYEVIS